MIEGQDWAGYQVAAPSTAGLAFAVVKATEGTGYVNPKHTAQVADARSHGLVVAHYHFARPGSMTDQVNYFLAHAGAAPGDFLAFDWEDPGVSSADKDRWLRSAKAKAPGYRVVLYSNRDFWLHRDTTSYCADGLWIADPSAPKGHPRVEHPWLFHQYSSAGGLDRNVANFPSVAALRAWAAGTAAAPQHQEDDMPTAEEIAAAVWGHQMVSPTSKQPHSAETFLRFGDQHFQAVMQRLAAQDAAITTLASLVGKQVDTAQVVAAVQAAVKDAVIKVDVDITQPTKES